MTFKLQYCVLVPGEVSGFDCDRALAIFDTYREDNGTLSIPCFGRRYCCKEAGSTSIYVENEESCMYNDTTPHLKSLVKAVCRVAFSGIAFVPYS